MGLNDHSANVARSIITAASRLKKTPQEIIARVSEEGLDVILPPTVREYEDYLLNQKDEA
jgi:hypothetical protein